jgi:hypothetical protein
MADAAPQRGSGQREAISACRSMELAALWTTAPLS